MPGLLRGTDACTSRAVSKCVMQACLSTSGARKSHFLCKADARRYHGVATFFTCGALRPHGWGQPTALASLADWHHSAPKTGPPA